MYPASSCLRRANILSLQALLILAIYTPSAGAMTTINDLEELAWHFRFTHGAAHTSVLLLPLQRTMQRMQEHVAANVAQAWEVKVGQLGLCVDECGVVEVL